MKIMMCIVYRAHRTGIALGRMCICTDLYLSIKMTIGRDIWLSGSP